MDVKVVVDYRTVLAVFAGVLGLVAVCRLDPSAVKEVAIALAARSNGLVLAASCDN